MLLSVQTIWISPQIPQICSSNVQLMEQNSKYNTDIRWIFSHDNSIAKHTVHSIEGPYYQFFMFFCSQNQEEHSIYRLVPRGGAHLHIAHALRLLEPTKKNKSEGGQKNRSEAEGHSLKNWIFWLTLADGVRVLCVSEHPSRRTHILYCVTMVFFNIQYCVTFITF